MGATDTDAGVANVYFLVNNGKFTPFDESGSLSGSYTLTREKLYTIKVLAEDKLGNESNKIVKFIVKLILL